MKKAFLSFIALILLTGCHNVLDKKIDKTHFAEDLSKIMTKDSDLYSKKDFAVLTMGLGLVSLAPGDMKWQGTYREALDKIKESRLKTEADSIRAMAKYKDSLRDYKNKIAELTRIISLKITGKGIKSLDEFNISQGLYFMYTINNNSTKPVSAFKGVMYVKDVFGDDLQNLTIKYDNLLLGGTKANDGGVYDYNQYDSGQAKIADSDMSKLKFEWCPTEIIYQDGTKIVAPEEPEKPGE